MRCNMADEMRLKCQGMHPLHVLSFGSLGWDQRPPYGAYRVPEVDGATVTREVRTPGWAAL